MKPHDLPHVDYRSAKTGQFVTREYAAHHPATTIAEHNKLLPLEPGSKRK